MDPVPHVHDINLVSEDGIGRGVQDTEELTQIVRECVGNEITLQQCGSNASLFIENSL